MIHLKKVYLHIWEAEVLVFRLIREDGGGQDRTQDINRIHFQEDVYSR